MSGMRALFVASTAVLLLTAGCSGSGDEVESAGQDPADAVTAVTRSAAGLISCPDIAGPTDAPDYFDYAVKYGMKVTYTNATTWPMTLGSSGVDCFDFSGADNPSRIDGMVVAPGATSPEQLFLARRVCPYISGDIIGKFQEREAHWDTMIDFGDQGSVRLPSTIQCGSWDTSPTLCASGASQDRDSYTLDLGPVHAVRVDVRCSNQSATVTFSNLY